MRHEPGTISPHGSRVWRNRLPSKGSQTFHDAPAYGQALHKDLSDKGSLLSAIARIGQSSTEVPYAHLRYGRSFSQTGLRGRA